MSETDFLQKLAYVFVDASIPEPPQLTADLHFDAIEGLDSVSRVRLMMCVEDKFAVNISPRENSKLKTIGNLIDLIQSKYRD